MKRRLMIGKGLLLAGFASSVLILGAHDILSAPQAQPAASPAQAAAPAVKKPVVSNPPVRRVPNEFPPRAQMYYLGLWGIDSLTVKYTESGEMIRFSYRVVDPAKATQLNDKKAEPYLYDPQARVRLVVPQMEKVGKLRQSSTPIAGRSYWMAFSNSGRQVRPGDRVSVEIGNFRAINLLVE
jgi:hypothetical protein